MIAGCGGSPRLPRDYLPLAPGRTPAYRAGPTSRPVAIRRELDGLRCARTARPRFGVHFELYAYRLVVRVPAGIGFAPPLQRHGAYVIGGRCWYAIRTREPTGVLELARSGLTLGTAFDVWGQPLSGARMAGFRGAVRAYVDGRRWRGSPRAIPLRRHAEIVLEVGPTVPPHPGYLFPPGL